MSNVRIEKIEVGQIIGKLEVLKIFEKKSSFKYVFYARCKCKCNKIIEIRLSSLICGIVKSCGCTANKCQNSCGNNKHKDFKGFCKNCYDDFQMSKTNNGDLENFAELFAEIMKIPEGKALR